MPKKKRSEKFTKIKQLRCLDDIEFRLLCGHPTSEVARYIQQERGEYLDVTLASLGNALGRYRQTLVPADVILMTLPPSIMKKSEDFTDKLKILKRMERLYRIYEYRLDLAHGHERMEGVMNDNVTRMGREIRELLFRMHSVTMDLGLVGSRDLGTVAISPERLEQIRDKYGDESAEAYSDPVSRGRIFSAVKATLELAAMKGEPMEEIEAEFEEMVAESSEETKN